MNPFQEDGNMSNTLTPSEQLAGVAFASLAEKGLLRIERRANIIAKLSSGKMSQEDWSLEIELAAPEGQP